MNVRIAAECESENVVSRCVPFSVPLPSLANLTTNDLTTNNLTPTNHNC